MGSSMPLCPMCNDARVGSDGVMCNGCREHYQRGGNYEALAQAIKLEDEIAAVELLSPRKRDTQECDEVRNQRYQVCAWASCPLPAEDGMYCRAHGFQTRKHGLWVEPVE